MIQNIGFQLFVSHKWRTDRRFCNRNKQIADCCRSSDYLHWIPDSQKLKKFAVPQIKLVIGVYKDQWQFGALPDGMQASHTFKKKMAKMPKQATSPKNGSLQVLRGWLWLCCSSPGCDQAFRNDAAICKHACPVGIHTACKRHYQGIFYQSQTFTSQGCSCLPILASYTAIFAAIFKISSSGRPL